MGVNCLRPLFECTHINSERRATSDNLKVAEPRSRLSTPRRERERRPGRFATYRAQVRSGWPPKLSPDDESSEPRQLVGDGVLRGLAVVVALALVAVLGWYAYLTFLADDEESADPPGPSSWDPRVQPLVDFVEKERGLSFDHPVEVRFLAPARFEKAILADGEEGTAEDQEELEQYAGLFRAIGLLADGVDLGAVTRTLTSTGTTGYYAFDDRTIRVRGSQSTPEVRKTLVRRAHPRPPGPALRHRRPVRGAVRGGGLHAGLHAADGHRG